MNVIIRLVLNVPWTALGLLIALLSIPRDIHMHHNPLAVLVTVRSFWYCNWLQSYKGVRALTQGNVVILGPAVLKNDLDHELIHIEQFNREPFVHPLLYALENARHDGKTNRYEREAYERSNSTYLEK